MTTETERLAKIQELARASLRRIGVQPVHWDTQMEAELRVFALEILRATPQETSAGQSELLPGLRHAMTLLSANGFDKSSRVIEQQMELLQVRAGQARQDLRPSLSQESRAVEPAAGADSAGSGWQPIETAPKDGTLIQLLIYPDEERCCPLEDTGQPSRTIGHNNFKHDGEDRWQFAGWNWEQDHYTAGEGNPCSWQPLPLPPANSEGETKA